MLQATPNLTRRAVEPNRDSKNWVDEAVDGQWMDMLGVQQKLRLGGCG